MALTAIAVVTAAIVLGGISYFVILYNGLIQIKHETERAWANIDVILKERHDEIPKLISAAEAYMKYEQSTLKKVIEARNMYTSARSVDEKAEASGVLTGALRQLFAVAEQYPDLKSNANFMQLQSRITTLEENLADRRELFNSAVNNYNIRIEQLPDAFVARMLAYQPKTLFVIEEDEKTNPGIEIRVPA